MELIFLPRVAVPRVYVHASELCCFHSLVSPSLSEGTDGISGQMLRDKRVPLQWRN